MRFACDKAMYNPRLLNKGTTLECPELALEGPHVQSNNIFPAAKRVVCPSRRLQHTQLGGGGWILAALGGLERAALGQPLVHEHSVLWAGDPARGLGLCGGGGWGVATEGAVFPGGQVIGWKERALTFPEPLQEEPQTTASVGGMRLVRVVLSPSHESNRG